MKPIRATTFRTPHELYNADTCKPLVAANKRGSVELVALARRTYPGRRLPSRDLMELCSIGYWNARHNQRWGLDWHRNEGIELTYLAAGRLPFRTENGRFDLKPNEMTITRPWQRHCVGDPHVPASRLIWLILDLGVRRPNQSWQWPSWVLLSPSELKNLTNRLRHNERAVWRAGKNLGACFENVASLLDDPLSALNVVRLKLVVNQLLIGLATLLNQESLDLDDQLSSSERTVRLFLADLSHRLDEPWTLLTMADECGLGRSFFSHYCKQITNSTPIEYLMRCRIDAAKKRLGAEPDRSITEIAFACGFQSSQYFATRFLHQTGQSPRAWREHYLRQRQASPNRPR